MENKEIPLHAEKSENALRGEKSCRYNTSQRTQKQTSKRSQERKYGKEA